MLACVKLSVWLLERLTDSGVTQHRGCIKGVVPIPDAEGQEGFIGKQS